MIFSSKRVAFATLLLIAALSIAVQATENVDIVESDFAGVGPEALTPVEGHPVPEHVGPPPSKVGVKSIVPMAVVLSVLGAVIVLGISAGIFTWIYHYRGRSSSTYHPQASINDDAVTPAMVENYEEHYDESSSLLNR